MAVHWEGASVEDGEIWLAECRQLRFSGADEHVVHEESMVGTRAHHTHLDASLHKCMHANEVCKKILVQ